MNQTLANKSYTSDAHNNTSKVQQPIKETQQRKAFDICRLCHFHTIYISSKVYTTCWESNQSLNTQMHTVSNTLPMICDMFHRV